MFSRDFVEQHYVELKKANPTFPIRECSGVQPKLWARSGESIVSVARRLTSVTAVCQVKCNVYGHAFIWFVHVPVLQILVRRAVWPLTT